MTENQAVIENIVELEDRIDEIEQRLQQLDVLEEKVAEIDARTDIMQLVETVEEMSAEAKSIRILQHMQRKAEQTDAAVIRQDKSAVEECLHYPDQHRTTFYSDMERCAALLDDEDVCWYEGQGEGPLDEPHICLNYERLQETSVTIPSVNGGA